ncbi:PBP1A family penicillin-binding protein [uncultured Roseibium sp.]|uniref:transglycosylase domain-containing protein n=1 Tax=uncultured Roseibium sp. TaxID=1936171 RepID=UPI0032163866
MTRKAKSAKRIEPIFGDDRGGMLNLRPSARDRAAAPSAKKTAPKPKKAPAKSSQKAANQKPAGRKPAGRKPATGRKGGGSRRSSSRKRNFRSRMGAGTARFFKRAFYWSCVLGIWAGIFAVGFIAYYAAYLPPTSEWKVPARPPNVKIVSASGALIANRGDTGGEAVRLEQLPPYVPNAVIAIEDRRFRSHFGLDPLGLVRAVYVNLTSGNLVQGGSTLTQQLAKNLFLEPDRTLKRKVQELVLSIWLEAKFSKDEIMEMYLNRVYYGSGAYGIDAAARRYFGKSARLLTIAEAATLAGVLKAPSRYSPTRNPDLAEARAQLVLTAMNQEGFISDKEAASALAAPATAVRRYVTASENFAADYVMDMLPHYVGSFDGDIIVDTTIDLNMQHAAEEALRTAISENRTKYGVSQGAVVTLDTAGAIRAMVGGADYAKSQYNRAVYAKRQPGSAFKPFVYLAALEAGMTPETVRQDQPIRFKDWTPQNYTKKYYGPVTLTQALAMSLNTVAARLAYEVGPKTVAKTAKRLGITSDMKPNLSIALGTSEVTPLEIAGAYVPFSNGGYGVLPHIIRRIKTVDGKQLYSRKGDGPGRVVDRQYVRQMNAMMSETLLTGTGKKAQLGDHRPAGGKTGTSQDFRDGWFIGYTGNLTTAVWLGNDDNSPTKKATGGSLPAVIWKNTMEKEHEGLPVASLSGVPDPALNVATPVAKAGAPLPPGNVGENGSSAEDDRRPRGPLNLLKSLFGG